MHHVADTSDNIKESKVRVQRAAVEAAMASCEAGAVHAGCGISQPHRADRRMRTECHKPGALVAVAMVLSGLSSVLVPFGTATPTVGVPRWPQTNCTNNSHLVPGSIHNNSSFLCAIPSSCHTTARVEDDDLERVLEGANAVSLDEADGIKRQSLEVHQKVQKQWRHTERCKPQGSRQERTVGWLDPQSLRMEAHQEIALEGNWSSFLLAQETHLRLQDWRACILLALAGGEWETNKQMAQRRCGAGASSCARSACLQSIEVALFQADTGAGLTQENWQLLGSVGRWLTSQAMPSIGGDIQVEPKQLEDSGCVCAAGGFLVAPKLATVTPSHHFVQISQDIAGAKYTDL